LKVDQILGDLLTKSLDQDTFTISSKRLNLKEYPQYIFVDQTSTSQFQYNKTNELLSSTSARSVAIVDRTADIEIAAQAIINARFSFQGQSPYAPDLVIVNEFVKKDFFAACTRYLSQSFGSRSVPKYAASLSADQTRKAIKNAEEQAQLTTFGSNNFMMVDILDRYTPIQLRIQSQR
jgi:hypothetical protein